jgi:hypothetical protein
MMPDLTLAGLFTIAAIVVLGAVYVWSNDAGRRERAWTLLMLIRRRP